MSTYEETVPPELLPPDETPTAAPEYACEVCGKELHYGGRGRKPKFCEDHRKGSGTKRASSASNQKLADQATDALMQLNGLMGMGLMFARLPMTASALALAQEGFREQANAALLTDPDLCKMILRAGTTSGRMALVIAYGMLGAAVAPVGVSEFRELRKVASEDRAGSDLAA